MTTATLIFGIVLIVAAVFLVIAVLMQQGKSHNLSGTIAGGAETFFGKSKGQTMNKKLNTLTTIVAIVFVLVVLGFYVTQTPSDYASLGDYFKGNKTVQTADSTEDTADSSSDTTADTTAGTAADTTADTSADTAADAADSEG